jgi:hypothetical protein
LIRSGRGVFPVSQQPSTCIKRRSVLTRTHTHTHTGYRRARCNFAVTLFHSDCLHLGCLLVRESLARRTPRRAVQLEQPINYDSYATPTHKFRSTYSSLLRLLYYCAHTGMSLGAFFALRIGTRRFSLGHYADLSFSLSAARSSSAHREKDDRVLVCCRGWMYV